MSSRPPADSASSLCQFEPSPHWGETFVDAPALHFAPACGDRYEAALEQLTDLVRFVGGVEELFATHRPGQNLKGFDSLYLGPSGRFYLLHPHTHDRTAGSVMRLVHEGVEPARQPGSAPQSAGWAHAHLTLASGIQRVQLYSDGMGVTVEMGHPPNRRQLGAVREAYLRTSMSRFAAEIDRCGRTLVTVGSFDALAQVVHLWNPHDLNALEQAFPALSALRPEPREAP